MAALLFWRQRRNSRGSEDNHTRATKNTQNLVAWKFSQGNHKAANGRKCEGEELCREVRLGDAGDEHQVINEGGKPDDTGWDQLASSTMEGKPKEKWQELCPK